MRFQILKNLVIGLSLFVSSALAEDSFTATEAGQGRLSIPLITLGGKQYYFEIYFKANWFHAYQYCRKHGMYLISVMSQDENNSLYQYTVQEGLHKEYWCTSGSDLENNDLFVWVANGSNLNYTAWNPDQPDHQNGNEHCLHLLRSGDEFKWNDLPCSIELFFICEYL